jgi:hypothetical protein
MAIAVLFTITKTQNQLKCLLIYEWIKKSGIYTQWTTFSHKKNAVLLFAATWLDILLSEISQAHKNKYHMFSLIRGN